jgi:hypothetical protein
MPSDGLRTWQRAATQSVPAQHWKPFTPRTPPPSRPIFALPPLQPISPRPVPNAQSPAWSTGVGQNSRQPAQRIGSQPRPGELIFVLLVLIVLFGIKGRRKRSRYIPVRTRRLADADFIQRWYSDPNTREKRLRRSDYHYDHRWPFSKGGSHNPSNVRVISKKENLRKGAKIPGPFD